MPDEQRPRPLDKYRRPPSGEDDQPLPAEDRTSEQALRRERREATPEHEVYGALVQLVGGLATMLDLRFRSGHRRALPYSYLSDVEFDPGGTLTLAFPSVSVAITGRALSPVYQAIITQTALAVVESRSAYDDGGDEPYVDAIVVSGDDDDDASKPT
tara:strand:- start:1215 stop:1685 length:471 start_codon:yes stop_codon:yes gene_type:complete